MRPLGTAVDPHHPRFVNAASRLAGQVEQLHELAALARLGGPEEARAKHVQRGKLLPRQRVESVLDLGTPFLELSPLAAHGMYGGEVPGAGCITGIGTVRGRLVTIIANDATVNGGTYHPVSVTKSLRAQEIAERNRLPCLFMVDSGGAFLPLQSEMFADREHGGRMFYNQARMSSKGIPQIALVMGSCTAGGAYVPAMSDEVVIVREQGTIFLAGPPLVLAATGERVSAEELGGGDVHARVSGVADHLAEDDSHALELARGIVENLPPAGRPLWERKKPVEPAHSPSELHGILGEAAPDPREVLARLLDASLLEPLETAGAPEVAAGFARLVGHPVAVAAAFGALGTAGARLVARLVELAGERRLPVVFLAAAGEAGEAGRVEAMAALMDRVARLSSPLVSVIAGPTAGAAHVALSARSLGARFVFAWPTAAISATGMGVGPENGPIDPLHATARIFDDGLVDPATTREVLGLALEATRRSDYRGRNP
ncbi:MAG: methylcrotonoyl-CoA carboxylase [Candidatus Wallbacteria bacterium]|nr:methylcrotonoyl-CoA carboxylase [Candidatus Wallbacteria bacterium]